MKITKRKIIQLIKVEHNRGFVEETEHDTIKQEFYRLIIKAVPDYDYSNWTKNDLKDLADAINEFLKLVSTKG